MRSAVTHVKQLLQKRMHVYHTNPRMGCLYRMYARLQTLVFLRHALNACCEVRACLSYIIVS